MRSNWRCGLVLAMATSLLLAVLTGPVSQLHAADAPKVVVTILPLHSIAAAVMEGRGKPELLLSASISPHDFSLRPSQARSIDTADLLVWIGPSMESGLQKIIVPLEAEGRLVTLQELPYLQLLSPRKGGLWEGADEDDHSDDPGDDPGDGHEVGHVEGHDHAAAGLDPHLWLDPENGRLIANYLAQKLEEIDPEFGPLYRRNATEFTGRLSAAENRMRVILEPLTERPYLVAHDAFQYFERRFELSALGSLAISPERPPGAKRVLEIRALLLAEGAHCVFAEPQFQPKVLETLLGGTEVKLSRLDALGAYLTPGPEAYLQLLEEMAANLATCLGT